MRSQALFLKFGNGAIWKISRKPFGKVIFGSPRVANFNETVAAALENRDANI